MKFIVNSLIAFGVMGSFVPHAMAQVKPDVTAADPTAMDLKARKIYERLTGTKLPADSPIVPQMVALLNKGDVAGAAQIATADHNFYNITIKLMALAMSTRDETIKTPLNDFVAGFIGVTRDQTDARELLTGNFYYMGNSSIANVRSNLVPDLLTSNNHYADLETQHVDLAANLVRVTGQQIATSTTAAVANPDPAGVLTSRAFMGAHALMGTNRRLVEYTFREFMCVPLSSWADTEASDLRIGRDVDRFPAGDHMKFLTSCKGCHTVMDGFRGAFANWDFDGLGLKNATVNSKGNAADFVIAADNNGVVTKMNKNNTIFPAGYVMTNNSWVNNAIRPADAGLFEWRGASASGNGVNSLATAVANSRRFSQCMAKHVYETVCRKTLDTTVYKDQLKQWGDNFEASGYKIKTLFENTVSIPGCLGN